MLLLLDGWFVRVLAAWVPQILVLLDVNPEESMLDEGLAREVVNRIQKLRKKVVAFTCHIFCWCFDNLLSAVCLDSWCSLITTDTVYLLHFFRSCFCVGDPFPLLSTLKLPNLSIENYRIVGMGYYQSVQFSYKFI